MPIAKMLRNLFRAQEILTTFFRYGFGDLVERIGLTQYLTKVPPQDETTAHQQMTPARRFPKFAGGTGRSVCQTGAIIVPLAPIFCQQVGFRNWFPSRTRWLP